MLQRIGSGVAICNSKLTFFSRKVAENEVPVHGSILHLLGFDHTRLTFRYGGRDFRLTDVSGKVVKAVLS